MASSVLSDIRAPRPAALRRSWPLALAVLIIAVVASSLCFTDRGRPALTSALFLPDMMVSLPVRPVTWITREPEVQRTYIDYGSGRILADIYRPGDGKPHPAVVFSMGAPPLDLDDSRLVKLAEDAARIGLVMVVPFSERLDEEQIETAEVDALVGIFQYLEQQSYVEPDRIGYMGVSVGGSLALLAATDPRISNDVDFVVAFGAYYDALDTLVAIGAQEVEYKGRVEDWDPDSHTVEVMALQLISELPAASDKRTMCKAFVDMWDHDLCGVPVNARPLSGADVEALTPGGRAAYDLLTSGDLAVAAGLVRRLPPNAVARLEGLSPNRTIDRLRAELFIIHDKGDKFVPYVESRRMRDALAGREDVHFTEVSLFEHVEPRLGRGGDIVVIDSTKLYYRLYQLLLKLT